MIVYETVGGVNTDATLNLALDCGAIAYGKPVVAVGGSSWGSDAACVITPNYSANVLATHIHEILCKPY